MLRAKLATDFSLEEPKAFPSEHHEESYAGR